MTEYCSQRERLYRLLVTVCFSGLFWALVCFACDFPSLSLLFCPLERIVSFFLSSDCEMELCRYCGYLVSLAVRKAAFERLCVRSRDCTLVKLWTVAVEKRKLLSESIPRFENCEAMC